MYGAPSFLWTLESSCALPHSRGHGRLYSASRCPRRNWDSEVLEEGTLLTEAEAGVGLWRSQDWDSGFPAWSPVFEFGVHGVSNCSCNAVGIAEKRIQDPRREVIEGSPRNFLYGQKLNPLRISTQAVSFLLSIPKAQTVWSEFSTLLCTVSSQLQVSTLACQWDWSSRRTEGRWVLHDGCIYVDKAPLSGGSPRLVSWGSSVLLKKPILPTCGVGVISLFIEL